MAAPVSCGGGQYWCDPAEQYCDQITGLCLSCPVLCNPGRVQDNPAAREKCLDNCDNYLDILERKMAATTADDIPADFSEGNTVIKGLVSTNTVLLLIIVIFVVAKLLYKYFWKKTQRRPLCPRCQGGDYTRQGPRFMTTPAHSNSALNNDHMGAAPKMDNTDVDTGNYTEQTLVTESDMTGSPVQVVTDTEPKTPHPDTNGAGSGILPTPQQKLALLPNGNAIEEENEPLLNKPGILEVPSKAPVQETFKGQVCQEETGKQGKTDGNSNNSSTEQSASKNYEKDKPPMQRR